MNHSPTEGRADADVKGRLVGAGLGLCGFMNTDGYMIHRLHRSGGSQGFNSERNRQLNASTSVV